MNCANCDEPVDKTTQEWTTCDFCGKKMHMSCAIKEADPIHFYFSAIRPEALKENRQDFCEECLDARREMVRRLIQGDVAWAESLLANPEEAQLKSLSAGLDMLNNG